MKWSYDPQARCWKLAQGNWTACVERWPASLEHVARIITAGQAQRVITAPHVFADMEAAQMWCLREIAAQEAGGS